MTAPTVGGFGCLSGSLIRPTDCEVGWTDAIGEICGVDDKDDTYDKGETADETETDEDDTDDTDETDAQTGTGGGSLISVGCSLGISDLSSDGCDLPLTRLSVFRGLLEGFNIPKTFTRRSPGSVLLRVEGWATAPAMGMAAAVAAPALNAAAAMAAFPAALAACIATLPGLGLHGGGVL